jgi:hypothetical protein
MTKNNQKRTGTPTLPRPLRRLSAYSTEFVHPTGMFGDASADDVAAHVREAVHDLFPTQRSGA